VKRPQNVGTTPARLVPPASGARESGIEPVLERTPPPAAPETPLERAAGDGGRPHDDADGAGDTTAAPSVRAAARSRRRYERAEVKEAKRFTRPARRRRWMWFAGVALVVVVLGGFALVPLSPLMSLRTIDVVGTQRLDPTTVRTALEPQLGTPLALVNHNTIERELAAFPLVRSFSVQVEPPGTLVVRVQERTPLVLLAKGGEYRLVDQAGVVLQATHARPGGYPLLTVPAGTSAAGEKTQFTSAATVLAALPAELLRQIAEVSATDPMNVTFTLRSGKSVVWGGPQDSDLKATVLAALLKGAPGAKLYDVSAPNGPVTG
jgi:cell division protein FtsQ